MLVKILGFLLFSLVFSCMLGIVIRDMTEPDENNQESDTD